MNNLFIVIYSTLAKNGGGRETWIEYFINNIYKQYDNIIIYALRKDSANTLDFSTYDNVELKTTKNRKNRFFNYLIYFLTVLKNLFSDLNYKNTNHIIALGPLKEGIVFNILKFFYRKQDSNPKKVLWLRNKGVSERKYQFLRVFSFLEKLSIKSADLIIANGYDTKMHFEKKYKNISVFVVPNAVEVERFSQIKIPEFRTEKKINLAYLGRFTRVKGFNYFEQLSKEVTLKSKMNFLAWGWGYFSNEKIYQGVYTTKDLNKIFQIVDIICILNSNQKYSAGGISHSMLEAMNAARLIIAWDNYTHRQVLNHKNSILIPEGDYYKLKDTLAYLPIKYSKKELKYKCIQARKDSYRYSVKNHIKKFKDYLNI